MDYISAPKGPSFKRCQRLDNSDRRVGGDHETAPAIIGCVGMCAGNHFEAVRTLPERGARHFALFKSFVGTGKSNLPESARWFVYEGFLDVLSYGLYQCRDQGRRQRYSDRADCHITSQNGNLYVTLGGHDGGGHNRSSP